MPQILDGSVAIVTGGARGIGEEYVLALASAGARVAIVDLLEDQAQSLASKLADKAVAFAADVSDTNAMNAVARQVHERWGRIDILVNNAAIFADDTAGFAPLTWNLLTGDMEDWRRLRSVNVEGVVNGIRAVAPFMQGQKYGRIINQSSIGGFMDAGGIYGLSKLEVAALTRMFAHLLGPDGITVNAIAPGPTSTAAVTQRASRSDEENTAHLAAMAAMIPARRVASPQDMITPLLFFASPGSGYVSGQTLFVDGGFVRHI